MAAGKHGSSEITVTYDDAGGTPRVITGFILEMGSIKLTSQTDPSTPYGASVMSKLPTGVSEIADMTFEGFFDDTATTGPHTVFGTPDTNPQGATRTLAVVVGNAKTWTSEGYMLSYEVVAKA